MSPSEIPAVNQVPLVVDLDGTLIKTDLMWEHLARLFSRNPFWLFPILFWWMRGRAFLKQQLARRVKIDPTTLPYQEPFLAYLRTQKTAGRKLILATASDLQMALPVARHVGLFDEVLGSDGKVNLRSENKFRLLTKKFGSRGFDYAGNSSADFAVWRGAREAIVVNASPSVLEQAAQCTTLGPTFMADYSCWEISKRMLHQMFIRSGYLISIIAGLVMAAAFPKIGIAGFAWIGPALILFAAHGKSSGDAFRAGHVAGIVFWLASLYWLLLIPVPGFPILGWVLLSEFMALYFGLWAWLIAGKIGVGSWMQRTLWSLVGAAIWVGLEMIRARFLGGFPWNLLGTSQYQLTPLIQIASVTGVYGISFLVVWVSLALFSAVRAVFSKPNSRFAWQPEVFLPLLVVAGLFAWGTFQMRPKSNHVSASASLRITMIQPSVPQNMIWDMNANSNRFQQLLALTETALTNKPDLLIWPEAALPDFDDASYIAITNLIRAHHIWMIFNADDVRPKAHPSGADRYDVFNSAFLFDPDGKFISVYHKQKLVIFGEYIPLVRWLPFVKWFTPITGGYESGDKPGSFEISGWGERPRELQITVDNGSPGVSPHRAKISPLICFEDMFPQTARDSACEDTDFLVNLTNDGWFGEGAEQWQQAAAGIFRAVENGLPLVRSCNNGVTCWIDAHGRVRQFFKDATGTIYGPGFMTMELPLPAEKPSRTFYNRHGDWFGWGCVAIATVVCFFRKMA